MNVNFPDHLTTGRRELLLDVADRNDRHHGAQFLGMVLSGSAGRGLATERSDLDVYVVLADVDLADEAAPQRVTERSTQLDEIPVAISDLENVPPFGSPGWAFRWSFAWAPTLLDRTGGRIPTAARNQATLTDEEVDDVLFEHSRLDGWLNQVYRALKSDRDGNAREFRFDAAESMPWFLDVVFTLAGRVRPYHKYLPWELTNHPLPDWPGETLLDLTERSLDGDPQALREQFALIERACTAYDTSRHGTRAADTIAEWGEGLELLRP